MSYADLGEQISMAKKLSFWEEDVALVQESRYLRNSWPALRVGQKEKEALRKCLLRRLEWNVKEAQRMGLVPGNDQLFDLPVFRKAVADDDAWKRQKEQEKEKEEQARREAEEQERKEIEEARRRKEEAQAAERERERELKMQQRKEELRQRHNEETEKYKMEMAQYEVLKKRWENVVAAKASALKEAEETLMNGTAKKQELEHLMAEATAKKTELLGQLHVALELEKGDKSAEEQVNVSERFNLKKEDSNNRSLDDKQIHVQDIDSKSNEVIHDTIMPPQKKDRHVSSIRRQGNNMKRNWEHIDGFTSRKDKDIHDGIPSLSENKRSRSLSKSRNTFKRESPGDRGFHYYDKKNIHVRYRHGFDGSRRQVVDQWQESVTQDCRDRRGYTDYKSMLQSPSVSEKHSQERNFGSPDDKGAERSQYLEERVERRSEAPRRGQMRSMRSHLMKAPSQQERYTSNEQTSRHSSKLPSPPDNRRADFYRIRNSRGRSSSSRYHMDSRIRFSHEESFRRHFGERSQQREHNRKIGK